MEELKVNFQFKPLTKGKHAKYVAMKSEGDIIESMLSDTLWNATEKRLWTIGEINKGIPSDFQEIMSGIILKKSGFDLTKFVVDF